MGKKRTQKLLEYVERIDFQIWAITLVLCCFGVVMVYSASSYICANSKEYNYNSFYLFRKQYLFMILGFACMWVLQYINYNILKIFAWAAYGCSIISILLLIPFGVESKGAKRWLKLGPISFQVAELVKLCLILFLAYLVNKYYRRLKKERIQMTLKLWVAGGIPAGLLLFISNDLSSSVVILGMTFLISLVCMQTGKIHAAVFAVVLILAGLYIWSIAMNMPTPEEAENMPFRIKRIVAWLDTERYASGLAYQVIQGLYAIGSGGILGKGLGASSQKYGFLPEAQNDMIFSVICEELGLAGGVTVILLLIYLLYMIFKVTWDAENIYGSVLCMGVFFHISLQTVINIAVNIDAFPNTGLTLPFFSYGGTSICFLLIEIGIVLSVSRYHMIKTAGRLYRKLKKN
ncbi:MAG: FtsW/RodA/SpoVE family cell cycle protein [Blautia sp.]